MIKSERGEHMPGFEEIVGHEQIVTHLKSAMKLGKVSHAYILSGEKGCGKKLLADVFAETLQCEKGGTEPCGSCHSCVQAQSGNHPDIIHLMHEKPNSISVDDVRTQIVNDVLIKPYSGKYKIYIVPDAEKMTAAAQNALLKTIEEPPAYAVILLLANNASALLPTILSRCVMLSLKPVADDKVKQYLMEHVQVPDYEADVCVAFAQGNIGKAVQLATSDSFNEIKNSALHLLKNVSKMEINDIIATVKSVSEFKIDIQDYLDFLAVWYRDILYFKATRDSNGLIFKDELNVITDQINKSSYEGIENILRGLQTAKTRLNANAPTIVLSFRVSFAMPHTRKNIMIDTIIQNRKNFTFISFLTSEPAISRNSITGSATINTYLFATRTNSSVRKPILLNIYPNRIIRKIGIVTFTLNIKLSIVFSSLKIFLHCLVYHTRRQIPRNGAIFLYFSAF